MKIKDLNILDIANSLLKLTKKGNTYFAQCPHHLDATPSLAINPQKNIWKCFSCGESGGIIELIMFCNSCTRKQAMLYLADKFNVELDEKVSAITKMRDEIDLLSQHFERVLKIIGTDDERNYLANRGITEKDFTTFRLGTGTQFERVLKAIKNKTYNSFDNLLPLEFEYNDKCVFDKRIIFPVEDEFGIANFVGRSIEKNPSIRYLNGKDSYTYGLKQVGKCLFNLSNARKRINNYNTLIVVEGAFDAMALQKYDDKISVISTLGCQATNNQVDLMLGLSEDIIIFYDGDEAGVKASIELYKKIKKVCRKINVKFVLNSYELDPEELIQKEKIDELEVVSYYDFVLRNEQIESKFKSDLVFENLIFEDVKTISDVLLNVSNALFLDYDLVVKCYENFIKTEHFVIKSSLEFKEAYILKSLLETESYRKYRRMINPKSFGKNLCSIIGLLDNFFKDYRKIEVEKIRENITSYDGKKLLDSALKIKEEYNPKKIILEYLEEKEF